MGKLIEEFGSGFGMGSIVEIAVEEHGSGFGFDLGGKKFVLVGLWRCSRLLAVTVQKMDGAERLVIVCVLVLELERVRGGSSCWVGRIESSHGRWDRWEWLLLERPFRKREC